jgi:hypothetical protein
MEKGNFKTDSFVNWYENQFFPLSTNAVHEELRCFKNFYIKINSFWKRLILLKRQIKPTILTCYTICLTSFDFLHQTFGHYFLFSIRRTYTNLFLLWFWIMFYCHCTPCPFFSLLVCVLYIPWPWKDRFF